MNAWQQKQKKNRKTTKQQQEERKMQLLENIKKRPSKSTINVKEKESPSMDKYKKLYKKAKSDFLKAIQSLDLLKKREKQKDKKIHTLSAENKRLRKNLYKTKKTMEEWKTEFGNWTEEKKVLQETLLNQRQILTEVDENYTSLKKLYHNTVEELKKYREINKALHNKIKRDQTSTITILRNKIQQLEEERATSLRTAAKKTHIIQDLQKQIEKYKELDSEFLLQTLYENLSLENLYQYHLSEKLTRKYKSMLKTHFYRKKHELDYSKVTVNLFGYIKKSDNDEYVFVDLDLNEYKISYHPGHTLYENTPAAAFQNSEGVVDIYWYYSSEKLMLEDSKEEAGALAKNKRTGKTKEKKTFEYIGDFSVLIVTSLNGVRYKNRLHKHGINASWIDPYEKSPLHVKNMMEVSDIVILCVQNMPHSVLDFINREKEKYHFIVDHNEEKIVDKVKAAATRLKLISM
ncbi:hypothetical protein [Bacillus sp. FJAT-49736]|uniref:hypothetical protein n=1 Tax=Bacillus sp. FJAT-49736 TaxID=2833582 RepID=UPI001BC9BC15|nr:hypothetical protein [Bacillus sp. FJAT-49736]MBS4174409.1 hypothetical protein [Bacillus sp. FJAT-49736]